MGWSLHQVLKRMTPSKTSEEESTNEKKPEIVVHQASEDRK